MKAKYIRWLLSELDTLTGQEILDPDAAQRLRAHYLPLLDQGGRTREVVLAVLGAVLVSGGVILLLAHNWEELGRPLRVVLSFAPLVTAQALTFFALARRSASPAWREATATALSLALMSSIALISQTYQIPGDFGDLLLTCSVLTLPVIYLLDAAVPAALFLVGIAVWVGQASPSSATVPADLGYWLLLGLALPFLASLWRREPASGRTLLVSWALAGSLPLASFETFDGVARGLWPAAFALIMALLALEGARVARGLPWRKSPLELIGNLGVFGMGLALGSPALLDELGRIRPRDIGTIGIVLWAIFALLLARVAMLSLRALRDRRPIPVLIGLTPFLVALVHLGDVRALSGTLGLVIFNLLIAAWSIFGLARGLREGRGGLVHLGLAGFASLILFRFFESDLSLVARGLGFVVIGTAFLLVNVHLSRRLKAARGATS